MPGTRSRLRAVDASGARIAIEHGTASFQVTPVADDRRWQVDVGPFLVTVKGTVFTVSWDAATREVRAEAPARPRDGERAGDAAARSRCGPASGCWSICPRGETVISEPKPEDVADAPTARRAATDRAERPAAADREPADGGAAGGRARRRSPVGRGAGGRASRPHPRRGRARRA